MRPEIDERLVDMITSAVQVLRALFENLHRSLESLTPGAIQRRRIIVAPLPQIVEGRVKSKKQTIGYGF
jgi:hypothetical protein